MSKLTKILLDKKVAVVKTDTLYGLLGLAESRSVVDRIYEIKKRNPLKPVIVLVSNIDQIRGLGVSVSAEIEQHLNRYWPGPVSIILPVADDIDLHYLHKGTGGVSFRMPDDDYLLKTIEVTGPLVAPSANPEGETPAKNIKEAMAYFGTDVEYYDDRGSCLNTKASKIIRLTHGVREEIIRE